MGTTEVPGGNVMRFMKLFSSLEYFGSIPLFAASFFNALTRSVGLLLSSLNAQLERQEILVSWLHQHLEAEDREGANIDVWQELLLHSNTSSLPVSFPRGPSNWSIDCKSSRPAVISAWNKGFMYLLIARQFIPSYLFVSCWKVGHKNNRNCTGCLKEFQITWNTSNLATSLLVIKKT